MRLRRPLKADADGTAEIILLTDPIPRHVSLVNWGANDAPAVSWMSGSFKTAQHVLRSPPTGKAVDPLKVDADALRGLITETLEAWSSCIDTVLSSALQPADRASQVRSITIQAGARIAAASKLLGSAASRAAASHKSAGLKLPTIPTAPTLQGEIDRRAIKTAVTEASAYLVDAVLESLQSGGSTDSILGIFASVADAFSSAVMGSAPGVVGVASKHHIHHTHLENEHVDKLTIEAFQTLAASDPVKFLETIRSAVEAAKTKGDAGVSVAKKFQWGETGVEPFDPGQILSEISGFMNGDAITSVIANAISGVDLNKAVGSGVTVAASMRSGIAKFVTHEIGVNPEGDLALAIKSLVAPDVAQAVVASIKVLANKSAQRNDAVTDFTADEGDEISLAADLPSLTDRR